MAKYKQTKKIFLLKDVLFNKEKVERIANEIKTVYPEFKVRDFVVEIINDFPNQELMERIIGIRNKLHKYLPPDYLLATKIILDALPKPLDPNKKDNDFGDFIYAPYSYFVAEYGCTKKNLKFSFRALEEITKRFSCEAALRDFLNNFPEETTTKVYLWAKNKNYHVRRLASEGSRPNLPWAKKIKIDPKIFVPVLNTLYLDKTRFVTRSVANHLNDISKIYPELVIQILSKWNKDSKQDKSELSYITKHSLRTLIKEGNKKALGLLGFSESSFIAEEFKILTPKVKIGEFLKFNLRIKSDSKRDQKLKISYLIHFRKVGGKFTPKVFNLGEKVLKSNEELSLDKHHLFKLMSTRTLYAGEHYLEIQINGQLLAREAFVLE